jgi:murein DD-endopeptidase MepM/ murein hydrolase activator NlpD
MSSSRLAAWPTCGYNPPRSGGSDHLDHMTVTLLEQEALELTPLVREELAERLQDLPALAPEVVEAPEPATPVDIAVFTARAARPRAARSRPSPLVRLAAHLWLVGVVLAALLVRTVQPDALRPVVPVAAANGAAGASGPGGPGGILRAPVLAAAPQPGDQVARAALPQTIIPERPRRDVITYTVQPGDTLFGIAETFELKPETILWSNPDLQDNPHLLSLDQTLNILPVDGVYHTVVTTDTLAGLAETYKVEVSAIQNARWNDPYIGANGGLAEGSNLVIPGGQKKFFVWVIPVPEKRGGQPGNNNGTANVGSCPANVTMYGTGLFAWPTDQHWVSGNPYAPWHQAVDLRARLGDNVYASDSGTVIYAGWSTVGYGNLIVIDHGNGWQTWYAHLSQFYVSCNQDVWQGTVIGLAGSTGRSSGPHLHFETRWQGSLPNPLDVLPPP